MQGSGPVPHSRNHGTDRFYNPPAIRRLLQLQQQQQKQLRPSSKLKASVAVPESWDVENSVESDDSSSSKPSVCSSPPPPRPPPGNLDRFVEAMTPTVRAQYLSKTSMRARRRRDAEIQNLYYDVGDLWESFKEWSAYGAGVQLVLDGSDSVVQYYVPYLSAIQLYANSPNLPSTSSRRLGEESDGGESCRETSSEESANCDADGPKQDGARSNGQGLIFEYFERDNPYNREPLADKISALARQFPELKKYRSCDLHSISWISVAWYPIYRIPMGPTLRNLDACFLTFHSLPKPLKCTSTGQSQACSSTVRKVGSPTDTPGKLSLPVFGLAHYKFHCSIWTPNIHERQQASSLLQTAENWLRLLQVDHPDFTFFDSRNTLRR